MNTTQNFWSWSSGLLSDVVVQAVLGVLTLLTICSIAYYVLARWRDSNTNDSQTTALNRKIFEEMRSAGDINETEFRNITALLSGADVRTRPPVPKPNSDSSDSASQKDTDSTN